MNAKQNLLNKFQEVTAIDIKKVMATESSVESANFPTFKVSDELNRKMLAFQGFNFKSVQLIPAKKFNGIGKQIYLFRVDNDTIISFYKCYAVNADNKAVEPVKVEKSVPVKAEKKAVEIVNLDSYVVPELKPNFKKPVNEKFNNELKQIVSDVIKKTEQKKPSIMDMLTGKKSVVNQLVIEHSSPEQVQKTITSDDFQKFMKQQEIFNRQVMDLLTKK